MRRSTLWKFIAAAGVAISASGLPIHADLAADALRPENDRVTQLERQIVELQRRLERLEAGQGVRPAAQDFDPDLQHLAPGDNTWPSVGLPPSVLPPVGASGPAPKLGAPPQEFGQEINGVKYRMRLLGGESKPAGDQAKSPPKFYGITITR